MAYNQLKSSWLRTALLMQYEGINTCGHSAQGVQPVLLQTEEGAVLGVSSLNAGWEIVHLEVAQGICTSNSVCANTHKKMKNVN